jgi:hypothetical protein
MLGLLRVARAWIAAFPHKCFYQTTELLPGIDGPWLLRLVTSFGEVPRILLSEFCRVNVKKKFGNNEAV